MRVGLYARVSTANGQSPQMQLSEWRADFSLGAKRFRLSLETSDHREAARREKLRISEAQNGGGLLPGKVAKLTITEAAELYLARRESEVSDLHYPARTGRLETGKAASGGYPNIGQITPDLW